MSLQRAIIFAAASFSFSFPCTFSSQVKKGTAMLMAVHLFTTFSAARLSFFASST